MIAEGILVQYAGLEDEGLKPGDVGLVILCGESGSYVHWQNGEAADYIGLYRNSLLEPTLGIQGAETWDTGEVILWFQNDYGMYQASRDSGPEELQEMWHESNPNDTVDETNVDWQQVYDYIHMDDDLEDEEGSEELHSFDASYHEALMPGEHFSDDVLHPKPLSGPATHDDGPHSDFGPASGVLVAVRYLGNNQIELEYDLPFRKETISGTLEDARRISQTDHNLDAINDPWMGGTDGEFAKSWVKG